MELRGLRGAAGVHGKLCGWSGGLTFEGVGRVGRGRGDGSQNGDPVGT